MPKRGKSDRPSPTDLSWKAPRNGHRIANNRQLGGGSPVAQDIVALEHDAPPTPSLARRSSKSGQASTSAFVFYLTSKRPDTRVQSAALFPALGFGRQATRAVRSVCATVAVRANLSLLPSARACNPRRRGAVLVRTGGISPRAAPSTDTPLQPQSPFGSEYACGVPKQQHSFNYVHAGATACPIRREFMHLAACTFPNPSGLLNR
ncbi:hypothetical protein DFJ73DRAFT_958403 [Zopfochytrium polystomum]|nr:hypothetical protein DFJ73DRAFT_958403 [Zopfochytrium polystomum]